MAKNYYEALGVSPDASAEQVKRAYRRLALIHHPDVGGRAEKFRDVDEAYKVVGDKDKRGLYDSLGHEKYKEQSTAIPKTSSVEEVFEDWLRREVSTATSVDRFVGAQYPSAYVGGEGFEDPFTGDILSSAQDIRIAKMEQADITFHEQIELLNECRGTLSDTLYEKLWKPISLLELGMLLRKENWLSEEEWAGAVDLLDEYAVKREEYIREKKEGDRLMDMGDPIQENLTLKSRGGTKEAEILELRSNEHGRRPQDNDERKKWRKEAKKKEGGDEEDTNEIVEMRRIR